MGDCGICGLGGPLERNGNHASCNSAQRKAERAASKPKKKPKPIRQMSAKKSVANRAKMATYEKMDETEDRFCSGCGRASVPLSHSHIISVKKREDLEAEPLNIVYDCLDTPEGHGCHTIWEHGGIEEKLKLNNFWDRVEVIEKFDVAEYVRITFKINEYYEHKKKQSYE